MKTFELGLEDQFFKVKHLLRALYVPDFKPVTGKSDKQKDKTWSSELRVQWQRQILDRKTDTYKSTTFSPLNQVSIYGLPRAQETWKYEELHFKKA